MNSYRIIAAGSDTGRYPQAAEYATSGGGKNNLFDPLGMESVVWGTASEIMIPFMLWVRGGSIFL